jgi:hypothetical protein
MPKLTQDKPLSCLTCYTRVSLDQEACPKCGQRLKPTHPRVRLELEPAAPPVTPTVAADIPPRPGRALSDLSSMSVTVQLTGQQQAAVEAVRGWYDRGADAHEYECPGVV